MLFPTREVLNRFSKWFIHLWGFLLYFGRSSFLSFMSCFHTIWFSYEGCTIYVHYYSSLFNGRIHTNIHLFIHVIQSLLFSLFFLCMLVRIILIVRSIAYVYSYNIFSKNWCYYLSILKEMDRTFSLLKIYHRQFF